MKIWLTRHGQTRLNRMKLMQGRTDEPLNERGLEQAKAARARIGDVHFDAVYASPLERAVVTAAIIGGCRKEDVILDERLIEADFGRYEMRPYTRLGPRMTLYWACPELFPAPETVEHAEAIAARSASFLRELEQKGYENVLIAAHSGINRGMNGYLLGRKNGLLWRPKMKNCEVRVYESDGGKSRLLKIYPAEREKSPRLR